MGVQTCCNCPLTRSLPGSPGQNTRKRQGLRLVGWIRLGKRQKNHQTTARPLPKSQSPAQI